MIEFNCGKSCGCVCGAHDRLQEDSLLWTVQRKEAKKEGLAKEKGDLCRGLVAKGVQLVPAENQRPMRLRI